MPALDSTLLNAVSSALNSPIISCSGVSGGDISDAYALKTRSGRIFLKVMSRVPGEAMFQAEAKGLLLLGKHSDILRIPETLAAGQSDGKSFLAMEFLTSQSASTQSWEALGIGLAKLHSNTSERFGLEHDNYIGSLPQVNDRVQSWPEFYATMRIQPLMDRAQAVLNKDDGMAWGRIRSKIGALLPDCSPSLTHGDLWSGNIMHTDHGPAIFDPAVSYANREMDIAMTRLFGGFTREFYHAYNDQSPLDPGFEERLDLYQLYYILAHAVLFGGHYVHSVKRTLSRYS